jgi:hypothetical protein
LDLGVMAKPERNEHDERGDDRRERNPQRDGNLKSERAPVVHRNTNTRRKEDGDELLHDDLIENSIEGIGTLMCRGSEARNFSFSRLVGIDYSRHDTQTYSVTSVHGCCDRLGSSGDTSLVQAK